MLLNARQAEGDHGDILVARLFQGLAQQGDVVGGPAAAAGLELDHGHLVGIVFSRLQRLHQLADDQNGGITGVVVNIAQARFHHLGAFGFQNFHMVAVGLQNGLDHPEVHGQHIGTENGIALLLHFLGKGDVVLLHGPHFLSSRAPRRLRSRIFTAPRLVISSILIWV